MKKLTEYINALNCYGIRYMNSVIRHTDFNIDKATDRLAAYEKIGLEPEEIEDALEELKTVENYASDAGMRLHNYKELEEQGLLIKIPCKVGDTVYALSYADDEYYPRKVSAVKLTSQGFVIEYREKEIVRSRKFGIEVFLTREEAEKALEEK